MGQLQRFKYEALPWSSFGRETPAQHRYFDIFSMGKWAAKHVERGEILLDWDRAQRLIESGAVAAERIMRHTIHREPDPIIVGRHAAGPFKDQILDGGHRYVASALSATSLGLAVQPCPVPCYMLQSSASKRGRGFAKWPGCRGFWTNGFCGSRICEGSPTSTLAFNHGFPGAIIPST